MQQWCLSLPGDPAWWQAVAGILQALFALTIWLATRRYVNLTNKYVVLTSSLVDLQTKIVALEKQSARRDLYDKRAKIYGETVEFLRFCNKIGSGQTVSPGEVIQYFQAVAAADFLFGQDVSDFRKEVGKHLSDHRVAKQQWENHHRQEDQNRVIDLESWILATSFDRAKEIFGGYLNLAEEPE